MIGKGDAHPFVGYFLSRYEREPPRRSFPSGSSPSSFSLSAKGAYEKSPKRLRSLGSLLFISFHRLLSISREPEAAETVLAHGEKEKKFIEEERAQGTTLLGATCSWSTKRQWEKQAIIENLDICRLSGILV
jgi:hypothetical protein